MQTHTLKKINEDQLIALIMEQIPLEDNEREYFPSDFFWKEALHREGYAPEFSNLDFSRIKLRLENEYGLDEAEINKIAKSGWYENIKFNNCKNIFLFNKYAEVINCQFTDCSFSKITQSKFTNVKFIKSDFQKSLIENCDFDTVTMDQCNFQNANLKSLKVNSTHIIHCDLSGSTWIVKGSLDETEYTTNTINENTNLENTTWKNVHNDKISTLVKEEISPSKIITQDELVRFIYHFIPCRYTGKRDDFPKNFNWSTELEKQGYKAELNNIDFSKLQAQLMSRGVNIQTISNLTDGIYTNINFVNCTNFGPIQNAAFNNCDFKNCSLVGSLQKSTLQNTNFNDCNLTDLKVSNTHLKNVYMHNCKLINTQMSDIEINGLHMNNCDLSASKWFNLNGKLSADEYVLNKVNENTVFQDTSWDRLHAQHIPNENQSYIVLLYSPRDGTDYTNKLLEYYRSKGMNVLLIPPETGINHVIFKQPSLISGIILPGGPNVPENDNDVRKKFEKQLYDLACASKIPLLGICRGHQFIGSQVGGEIKNLQDHKANEIFVKKKTKYGNPLHEHLVKKHQKYSIENPNDTKFQKDDIGNYTYHSMCAHGQGVFFDKNRSNKANVKIVAKSADRTPEALSINDHIITFQHHHEHSLSKLAKSILNQYLNLVVEFQSKNVSAPRNK